MVLSGRVTRHLLGVVLLSAALLMLSMLWWRQSLQQELTALRRQYVQQYESYAGSRNDYLWLQAHYRHYAKLRRSWQAGTATWLDSVRAAARDSGIPAMQYHLQPMQEQRYSSVGITVMRLQLGLNHEYQLSRLLARLAQRAMAPYRLYSCQLRRQRGEVRVAPGARNVQAVCELHWYSRKRKEPES